MNMAGTADEGMEKETPLPLLRPDLKIVTGPADTDGAPTYTIYDPVPRKYSKVRWAEALILERLRKPTTLHELNEDLQKNTTLRISDEELQTFISKAVSSGLTTSTLTLPMEILMGQAAMRKAGLIKWGLKNYLYIRIPLIKPDKFLTDTLKFFKLFTSGIAMTIYALFGFFGIGFLVQNWAAYINTFPYFFNSLGVFWYAASIIILKIIHEFAHAYTAKNTGIRVPVMGIAFMVLWPVAFCDVTDAWKIKSRKTRFKIAAAGIATEIVIAGIALVGWGMSGPGLFNSVCFVVSSVTLLSTLIVNLNPAMSFDGYYMLMDMWGVDNLRLRAFGVTKWLYRKHLFGFDSPAPESGLTPRRITAYTIYSVYAWMYRLVLYLGIAVLVYYKFTKTLGILLFSVEIWWFVVKPFVMEFSSVAGMRSRIRMTPFLSTVLGLLFISFAWAALPLERSIKVPAIIMPESLQIVYAPTHGAIRNIHVKKGDNVTEEQHIVDVVSWELNTQEKELQEQLALLEIERDNLELYDVGRAYLPQKLDQIQQTTTRLKGLEKEKEKQSIHAEISGKIIWWDDTLRDGRYVRENDILGRIANPQKIMIRAFVSEDQVSEISLSDQGVFQPISSASSVHGRIIGISPAKTEHMEHVALTSIANGVIPVVPDANGRMRLLDSYYAVELAPSPDSPRLLLGQSGMVRLTTKPRSLLLSWTRKAYRVILRESGF